MKQFTTKISYFNKLEEEMTSKTREVESNITQQMQDEIFEEIRKDLAYKYVILTEYEYGVKNKKVYVHNPEYDEEDFELE